MTRNLPVKEHVDLSPSSAYRWMACTGSVKLIEALGVSGTESVYAREGTVAHALAERALNKMVDPDMWLDMEIGGLTITDEMIEHVRVFVDWAMELRSRSTLFWIERKFNLKKLNPPAPMAGTSDVTAYEAPEKTLHVGDLKYGQGVVVEVTDNPQLLYYALGAVLEIMEAYPELEIEKVVITIIQPRAGHLDGAIRSQTVDLIDLLGFSNVLIAKAEETQQPNAPLVAGDHCRFCPAAAHCPALAAEALAVVQSEFSAVPDTPPPPEILPANVLGEMLQKLPILEAWGKSMWAEAQSRLERGEKVPGLKLVARRPRRKWLNETEAEKRLLDMLPFDALHKISLHSPAQIEKALGKKTFGGIEGELVEKVSSGNTVALDSDPRPEEQLLPGSEFADSTPLLAQKPNEEI